MSDRLDARIREMTIRLIQMSPEAPPFPEETMVQLRPSPVTAQPPKRRRPAWGLAVAALAVIAAVAIPAVLLGGRNNDAVEQTSTTAPPTTETTAPPTTTTVGAADPEILGTLPPTEPGQTVDLFFPDERQRGVGYSLEVSVGEGFDPRFWMIAAAEGYDGEPQTGTWETGSDFPAVAITGPGPDRVLIPDSADPGDYLLCQRDGVPFCWTIQLVASTVRTFTIDPNSIAPTDLDPTEVVNAGWGNGEFDLGLSGPGFGPCCFDVTSDGGIVFLDAENQRLMHWLPGGGSVFPLATFQPSELVADAITVGHDDRVYVLGMSNREGRPHDLVIIGLDGSVEGPYETVVDSNADLQATTNGIFAGNALINETEPVDGWIPIATAAGIPVPLSEQRPLADLPEDARSLRIDFAPDGTIIAGLFPGGDSLPIQYRVSGEYFVAGAFLQNRDTALVLVLGTAWTADEPSDFLILRAAVEGGTAIWDAYRIPGQQWAQMGAFGTVRMEGSTVYFMSTTPTGTAVASYDLP